MSERTLTEDDLSFGTEVYTEEGDRIGTIRGFDDEGFYVSLRDGIEAMSVSHVRSGQAFGEAELMWRCWGCGEMRHIRKDLPDRCPECGAPKEDLYYWIED